MVRAIWKGKVIAQSDRAVVIEDNVYFPPQALNKEFLVPSDHRTNCFWKGEASYYHVVVDGAHNHNAAWYYPSTTEAAKVIEGYVAFWNGVIIEEAARV